MTRGCRVTQEDTFDGRTLRYGYRSSVRLGRIELAADRTWRNLFYDRVLRPRGQPHR
ncbi:hypothetical protein WME94_02790 [Sorangium sp. So ce429]